MADTWICPECGDKRGFGEGVCGRCGAVRPDETPRFLRPLRPIYDSGLFWALVLLALAGIIVGVIWVNWEDTSREAPGSVEECREIGWLMDYACGECDRLGQLCADCRDWRCLYCEQCTSKPYDECMQWCW